LVFADMFPFCDVDHGGNVGKMASNIQEIRSMFPNEITIIPGHGKAYCLKDMTRYREMILCTYNTVRNQMNKGKSLEDIKKGDVLKFWKPWAIAFSCDDWIEMIYNSSK
jgi:cyclase